MASIVRFRLIGVILVVASARFALADDLALYWQGVKQFQAGDYVSAGGALSQLAPFTQEFGEQARYLLARVHDLSGERPEAIALYEAIANLSGLHDAEALRWVARAQVGLGVTPVQQRQNGAGILPNQQERKARLESAMVAMRKAVELSKTDQLQLELADLLRSDRQY